MARQPIRKYFPQRFGNQFLDQAEINADNPLAAVGELYSGVGFYQDTQLDDGEILALAAAPIEVVAAPGALRAVIVRSAYFFLTVVDGAYDDAAADGDLGLVYTGGADGSAGLIFEADAFIDSAIGTDARYIVAGEDMVTPVALEVTPLDDTSISLDNDGAEFTTAGNDTAANLLSVRVFFDIVDFAQFA